MFEGNQILVFHLFPFQAAALNEQQTADENGVTNGTTGNDKDSEAPSSEFSDELAASTGSFELSDVSSSSSSWAKFAQSNFQTKGCHSYSCSALQQPLLPKKDKGDILVNCQNKDALIICLAPKSKFCQNNSWFYYLKRFHSIAMYKVE